MAPQVLNEIDRKNLPAINDYLNKKLHNRIEINSRCEINWGSYTGAIKFPGTNTYYEKEKIRMGLPIMLNYLFDSKDGTANNYFLDPAIELELEAGVNYFNLVAFPFCSEVEKLVNCGIRKRYVAHENNLNFVRGRINFLRNELVNFGNLSKVYCNYEDFSPDTKKNRAILWAIEILLKSRMVFEEPNDNLRVRLNRLKNIFLEDGVTLTEMNHRDLISVNFANANRHYREPVSLAKVILRKQVYDSFNRSDNKRGINFLVNENWVFECFMTRMLEKVVKESFEDWQVRVQKKVKNLLLPKNSSSDFILKPDVILAKGNESIPLDFKYKTEAKQADYYQILAYSIALSKSKKPTKAILWCAENISNQESTLRYTLNPDVGVDCNLDIHVFDMDFKSLQNTTGRDFINGVKRQIREKLCVFLKYSDLSQ